MTPTTLRSSRHYTISPNHTGTQNEYTVSVSGPRHLVCLHITTGEVGMGNSFTMVVDADFAELVGRALVLEAERTRAMNRTLCK